MEFIFKGAHHGDEALASIDEVLQLFKNEYHISQFKEIHLSAVLLNDRGEEVELVDSESRQTYRVFEVYRKGYELAGRQGFPKLKLVVDNTVR